MKRVLAIILALTMLLSGCGIAVKFFGVDKDNKKIENKTQETKSELLAYLEKNTPDDIENLLMYIINFPSEESKPLIKPTENISLLEGEIFYVVPAKEGTKIKIYNVEFDEATENIKLGDVVYSNESTPKDFVLQVESIRPEGLPAHAIEVSYDDSTKLYYISYNGETGTPDIEFITAE